MLYSILWQAVLNFSVSPVPIFEHMFTLIFVFMRILSKISVSLQITHFLDYAIFSYSTCI